MIGPQVFLGLTRSEAGAADPGAGRVLRRPRNEKAKVAGATFAFVCGAVCLWLTICLRA
ncbi:hypothetical protein [Paragemmobacter ruber]|uniref:Uncharacterized protein n=1 Tax=Paragemmobacter ruber TaxID=1985673 RepID=A0ABW9Y4N8_9RHOB|nr:hypothetical protein [Rhodobacter ruber]NBE07463.1 hypothetical protein [Rhodobacter ruber]